mgnify:CR=1 FL=1
MMTQGKGFSIYMINVIGLSLSWDILVSLILVLSNRTKPNIETKKVFALYVVDDKKKRCK